MFYVQQSSAGFRYNLYWHCHWPFISRTRRLLRRSHWPENDDTYVVLWCNRQGIQIVNLNAKRERLKAWRDRYMSGWDEPMKHKNYSQIQTLSINAHGLWPWDALTQTTLFTFRNSVTYKIRKTQRSRYRISREVARKKPQQVYFQESAE
jgi:hypothetical protein